MLFQQKYAAAVVRCYTASPQWLIKQDIYIHLLLCAEAGLYHQHLLKLAHVSERPTCYVEVTLVANNMQQNIFAVLHSTTA